MADEVLRELREAIVEGRIAQGEQLREAQLARTFGIGRGALREALDELVQEGLVEYVPHRGSFVPVMSLEDRLDLYAAREALETGAIRRALELPSPPDLTRLRHAVYRLRVAAGSRNHVTDELIEADVNFHRELVALAHSPRLTRAHETLMAETRMLLRHHPLYPGSDYVSDHTRLLAAVERADPRAPDLVADHLRLSARLIADELARETARHDGAVDAPPEWERR